MWKKLAHLDKELKQALFIFCCCCCFCSFSFLNTQIKKNRWFCPHSLNIYTIMKGFYKRKVYPVFGGSAGSDLTTCDSYFTILVEVFTNHILAVKSYFMNHRV